MRHINPETSLKLADLTVAFKNKGVVGYDLAGAEEDFPAKRHKDAFSRVLANNINCTLHAGEAYGPESIHQAIHQCGAHRIGHGVRLIEDGDLLNYVNDHRIPLEMCPSSNLQTKVVKKMADHPIRLFYDLGLRVTVNTDNRLVTGTTRQPGAQDPPRRAALQPRGDPGHHHHGLQERLPALRGQAGHAGGRGPRAEELQTSQPGKQEGAALTPAAWAAGPWKQSD